MNALLKEMLKQNAKRAGIALRWVLFSLISGIVVGCVGVVFYRLMAFVTHFREMYTWVLLFLPIGGLVIVASYKFMHYEKDSGTNLVLSAIHSGDHIPFRMAPLIFISTVITHLFGGSAGREGAALQLGGSLGNSIGRLLRLDEKDKNIMIMCGMSAAFSALFGTPMAAAIFSMEVVSVGIMHYSALVPCVVASLIAHGIALESGIAPEAFVIREIPVFHMRTAVIISVLAVFCALVSVLFCVMLRRTEQLYHKLFKNPFPRMKMVFTALTIGAGFKGGEIVPSFFTGAAFGCLFGIITGFSPSLCTAIGMISVFCGVTNCPITSLLISFELFGYDGMPYFLLSVAFSYMLSGYVGLYHSQKIMYSKYKTDYINKRTK